MARRCEICGKDVKTGNTLSHSHIRTGRTFRPNLQKVRALVDGRPVRLTVCTRCLRSGRVVRAI